MSNHFSGRFSFIISHFLAFLKDSTVSKIARLPSLNNPMGTLCPGVIPFNCVINSFSSLKVLNMAIIFPTALILFLNRSALYSKPLFPIAVFLDDGSCSVSLSSCAIDLPLGFNM